LVVIGIIIAAVSATRPVHEADAVSATSKVLINSDATQPVRRAEASFWATPPPGTYLGIGVIWAEQESPVIIADVFPGSPAETGGLRRGAEIRRIDDMPVGTVSKALQLIRGRSSPFVKVEARNPDTGAWRVFNLQKRPVSEVVPRARVRFWATPPPGTYLGIGVTYSEQESPVIIADVFPGGPADTGGLRRGAEIRRIDDTPVGTVSKALQLIRGRSSPFVKVEARNPDTGEWRIFNLQKRPVTEAMIAKR